MNYTNLQAANNANTPEKPSRSGSSAMAGVNNLTNNKTLNNGLIVRSRIPRTRTKVALASGGMAGSANAAIYVPPTSWEQLVQDEHFLGKFFLYFNPTERRVLAQVR